MLLNPSLVNLFAIKYKIISAVNSIEDAKFTVPFTHVVALVNLIIGCGKSTCAYKSTVNKFIRFSHKLFETILTVAKRP